MNLSLSISPCPNDTFMFYALIHKKIETPFSFVVDMMDIDQLNQNVGKYDVTKISSLAYGKVAKDYVVLSSGAALGNNCGPLLLGKENKIPDKHSLIAIPGKYTTANFLLQLYLGQNNIPYKTMIFSEIMPAIQNETVTHGVVIHESRFTYHNYNLQKIVDLGEVWEKKYSLPIPLGLIIAKRNLGENNINMLQDVIRRSIEYSYSCDEWKDYVKSYAQEMDNDIIEEHIKLYVNDYSKNLETTGKKALHILIEKALEMKLI